MLMRNHQESQLLLVKEGDIYNKNLKYDARIIVSPMKDELCYELKFISTFFN